LGTSLVDPNSIQGESIVETTNRANTVISGDIPVTRNGGQIPRGALLNAIDLLVNEHYAVKQLLTQLPTTTGSERVQMLEEIKNALIVHNASEENVIYPAIKDLADRPQHATALYHQQDEAQVAVWELTQLIANDDMFVEKAEKLRDAILAHVQQEEEHEFPRLRELPAEAQARLNADMTKFRATFGNAGV
jgi:hemerythrin superfamily protein